MADITSIDRAAARKLGAEAQLALQEVANKYGLTLTQKGGTYSPNASTVKFVFAVAGADKSDFESYAHLYGLNAEDHGAEFKMSGKTFRITGINPRAPKFAILIEDVKTGKGYKCPTDSVLRALGRPVPESF
jgi:hypothetical protein